MIRHARGKDASHPASPSGERAASGRQVDYTYQIRSFRRFAKSKMTALFWKDLSVRPAICSGCSRSCRVAWALPTERVGKAEKQPPVPSGSPGEPRTAARTASRRARDTAHLLGDLLNWLARPLASTAWRGKKSALPLCSLVMMRGRDPGDRPDHRGRGQGLSESNLIFDLAGHGICLLSAFVFTAIDVPKGPPPIFDAATRPPSLCLLTLLGHWGSRSHPRAHIHGKRERA